MNITTKTVMITLIIVGTAIMSGCLTDEPNYVDNEETRAAILAEMEAINGEEYDLPYSPEVTPTSEPKYHLNCGCGDKRTDPINGVGSFKTWIGGVLEPDNTTISGFTDPSLDRIEIVEVFLNNESVDKYVPIKNENRKVTTTIIGDWNIKIVATLDDGTTLTYSPNLGGMKDLSDHPDYKKSEITVTGSGPFDARYVEPSTGMTRAEAKALCDELGIVWGDDRDIPIPKPTLTSTKVTPTIMPTTVATPKPEPTLPNYYARKIGMSIFRTQWDESTILFANGRIDHDISNNVENVKIYIDGQIVAIVEPTIPEYDYRYEIECPMIINLPNGVSNTGEIIVTVSVFDLDLGVEDGDYPIRANLQTPPMQYEEEYSQFPVWNP